MKTNKEAIIPAARAEDLIVQEMADEVLVYDQRRHQAHCLNETAAMVWQGLDGRSTAGEVAARLQKQRGVAITAAVVELAVEELGRRGLLREAGVARVKSGMSRRELIKRAGLGAAVALPVVASVVAPEAAQAATCKAAGQPCASPTECCSGLCPGAPTGTCS